MIKFNDVSEVVWDQCFLNGLLATAWQWRAIYRQYTSLAPDVTIMYDGKHETEINKWAWGESVTDLSNLDRDLMGAVIVKLKFKKNGKMKNKNFIQKWMITWMITKQQQVL
jgi:hypothetical protein